MMPNPSHSQNAQRRATEINHLFREGLFEKRRYCRLYGGYSEPDSA
jgi:hypothetical protein